MVVSGRTHNPFTGEPELWLSEEGNEISVKVREELEKAQAADDCIEVECDGVTLTRRPLKRTVSAALKILLTLQEKGKITAEQAVASVPSDVFDKLLNSTVADVTGLDTLGAGLPGSQGAVVGEIATSGAKVIELAQQKRKPILFVEMTTPEDMSALEACVAVVTTTGGFTSHSAVVARQMGKPCVVSYAGAQPDEGIIFTVDGTTGKLFYGEAKIKTNVADVNARHYMDLADKLARLKVYANADTEEHVIKAVADGAHGIGLCRTEHTFFTEEGLPVIRKLILAKNDAERTVALTSLQVIQTEHFKKVFRALGERPAVIRLLDPPLHEFLPKMEDKEAISALAKAFKSSVKVIKERIHSLHEENPMLGHRGCRLSITFPALARTQTKAIVLAARYIDRELKGKGSPNVGIMVPLIVSVAEMKHVLQEVKQGIEDGKGMQSCKGPQVYTVGAMLETPRACLLSYQLAEVCDFFSFGTNDLTQTTWALSRDDGAKFIPAYVKKNLLEKDPFETLDTEGVGMLMAHAVESLKDRRTNTKIGICGEQGGDPASITFCDKLGLDYVSCSPPRILQARLAAANCVIAEKDIEPIDIEKTITLEQPILIYQEPVKIQPATNVAFVESGWQQFVDQDLSAEAFVTKFVPCKVKINTVDLKVNEGDVVGYLTVPAGNWLVVQVNEECPPAWFSNPLFVPGKAKLVNNKTFEELKQHKKIFVSVDTVSEVKQQLVSTVWKKFTSVENFINENETLHEWLLYAKENPESAPAVAKCLGNSKALETNLICLFDNGVATQIDQSLVIAIAPPGSDKDEILKFVKPVEQNKKQKIFKASGTLTDLNSLSVVSAPQVFVGDSTNATIDFITADEPVIIKDQKPTLTNDKQSLSNLPYTDLVYHLAGKSVVHPYMGDVPMRVVGYIPGQSKDKLLVVQLPAGKGNDGQGLKQFIYFNYTGLIDKNNLWILKFNDISEIKD